MATICDSTKSTFRRCVAEDLDGDGNDVDVVNITIPPPLDSVLRKKGPRRSISEERFFQRLVERRVPSCLLWTTELEMTSSYVLTWTPKAKWICRSTRPKAGSNGNAGRVATILPQPLVAIHKRRLLSTLSPCVVPCLCASR